MASAEDMEQLLRAASVRLRWARTLRALTLSLLVGLFAACVALGAGRMWPAYDARWLAAALTAAGAVVGAVWGMLGRMGPVRAAIHLDNALGLHERLSTAAMAVRDGAFFVATNRDPVFPMPDGLKAGAGSMIMAIVTAGGREPDLVVGKPEPGLMREAAKVAGVPAEEAVVIGDGLVTDIAAAYAVGARSVLVLGGVSTAEQARALPPERRPTAIADGPEELDRVLDELAAASIG